MSTTPPDDNETYHLAGLAGLYALDALEGEDLERFERHLATNAELREEVAGFRATAARLGDVSAAEPPAALRDRVLAGVAATRQDQPVISLDERRVASARRRALLTVAASVAILAAAFGGYSVRQPTDQPSELARLLARPDARVVPLTGVDSTEASGRVVMSAGSNRIIVVSDTLPPTEAGRTYEVWRLDGTGAASKAGLFKPDHRGTVEASVEVTLADTKGFAITDEPDGGSSQPTTPILMVATLE